MSFLRALLDNSQLLSKVGNKNVFCMYFFSLDKHKTVNSS